MANRVWWGDPPASGTDETTWASPPPQHLRIGVIGCRGIPGTYSGIERMAEHLYPLLAARGHDVSVYCRKGEADEVGPEYRGVHRILVPALRARSVETLSHNLAGAAHALRAHYDMLQLEALAAGLLAPAAHAAGVPVVVRVNGLDWKRAKWGRTASRVLLAGERAAVRWADEIIVVSRELQEYYRATYGRATQYIPNGVEGTGRCSVRDHSVLDAFGLQPGRYVVFVGRLVPEKRVHDLIVAFRAMPVAERLAIVGEGSYTDAYVAELRELAAPDPRIVFTGFQSGPALEALLCEAAAFASPSELEGLPLAVLEALERGVPAILSDIAPHRELLESVPGYDLFHAPGDVVALTRELERVLAAPLHARDLARSARDAVRRDYAWSTIARRTEALYRSVVARHSARSGRLHALPVGAAADLAGTP